MFALARDVINARLENFTCSTHARTLRVTFYMRFSLKLFYSCRKHLLHPSLNVLFSMKFYKIYQNLSCTKLFFLAIHLDV